MTPCERLGYKVGDKFEVVGDHFCFEKGCIVKLTLCDDSSAPEFEFEGKSAFMDLDKVSKIENKSLLATRHDIIDAIRETGAKISLQDAMEIAETLLDHFNIEK